VVFEELRDRSTRSRSSSHEQGRVGSHIELEWPTRRRTGRQAENCVTHNHLSIEEVEAATTATSAENEVGA
jgi:hypothetical protein